MLSSCVTESKLCFATAGWIREAYGLSERRFYWFRRLLLLDWSSLESRSLASMSSLSPD